MKKIHLEHMHTITECNTKQHTKGGRLKTRTSNNIQEVTCLSCLKTNKGTRLLKQFALLTPGEER